jgi:hypothetical protein
MQEKNWFCNPDFINLLMCNLGATRKHWFPNPDFVFLDTIGCNKKVRLLEPRFLVFFFLMQLGASNLMPWNAMSNGCCVILSPILDIFHKSKEDKNTIYDQHTHTHMHKFVLLLPHDFSFFHIPSIASSLRLLSTWFGYFELEVLEILLAL